jgi:hypothetical protein
MKTNAVSMISFSCLLFSGNFGAAQTWMQTGAPSNYWTSIAASADGSKLTGVGNNVCYSSTNSGTTWTSNNVPAFGNGTLLTASADGMHLVAATDNTGEIDVSTNGGLNWKKSTNYFEAAWTSLTSSGDGKNVVLTEAAPLVRASTNWGATWYPLVALPLCNICSESPQYATISADGHCLTIAGPGNIFTTTNFGNTWTTNNLSTPWREMAASADGKKLITAPYGANIYTSTNSGSTWIEQTNSPDLLWWSCASSADGTKLAAISGTAGGTGVIYTSADSGVTWVSNSVPSQQWHQIVSSADGNKLFAIVNGNDPVAAGGIWTLQTTPSPQLNLSPSNGDLNFSWTVPSTNFILQQSPGLGPNNWTSPTNLPALNLSNLQEQLTLTPTNASGFFRLVSQ